MGQVLGQLEPTWKPSPNAEIMDVSPPVPAISYVKDLKQAILEQPELFLAETGFQEGRCLSSHETWVLIPQDLKEATTGVSPLELVCLPEASPFQASILNVCVGNVYCKRMYITRPRGEFQMFFLLSQIQRRRSFHYLFTRLLL